MPFTITTHLGSEAYRAHNRRDDRVVAKATHIREDGSHEIILDINPRDAYEQLFRDSIEEYNERQRSKHHPERQISNYYDHICKDKKKHPVYELIVSVGSKDNQPNNHIACKILHDYVEGFKKRNKNLVCTGIYLHNDEQTPHLHIDMVPVAYNMGRGPKIQNSLEKALNQQGFKSISIKETAQMAWEHSENAALEEVCKKYGLEIIHPKEEKRKHLDKEMYIKTQELKNINDKIDKAIDYHNEIIDDIEELETATIGRAEEILESYQQERIIER